MHGGFPRATTIFPSGSSTDGRSGCAEDSIFAERPRFDVLVRGSSTTLSAAAQRPHELAFGLSGPFALPDASQAPGSNVINYGTDGRRAGNAVLEYNITGLHVQLTPDVVQDAVGSTLVDIVGGSQLTFPFYAVGESFESTTLTFRPRVF